MTTAERNELDRRIDTLVRDDRTEAVGKAVRQTLRTSPNLSDAYLRRLRSQLGIVLDAVYDLYD